MPRCCGLTAQVVHASCELEHSRKRLIVHEKPFRWAVHSNCAKLLVEVYIIQDHPMLPLTILGDVSPDSSSVSMPATGAQCSAPHHIREYRLHTPHVYTVRDETEIQDHLLQCRIWRFVWPRLHAHTLSPTNGVNSLAQWLYLPNPLEHMFVYGAALQGSETGGVEFLYDQGHLLI